MGQSGYWQIPMVFGPANCAVENPLHVVPLGHPVPPTTQNFAHAKPNPIGDVHRYPGAHSESSAEVMPQNESCVPDPEPRL